MVPKIISGDTWNQNYFYQNFMSFAFFRVDNCRDNGKNGSLSTNQGTGNKLKRSNCILHHYALGVKKKSSMKQ